MATRGDTRCDARDVLFGRRQADERLASLRSRDANERLKKVMRTDAKLSGKVKAGASH